MTHTSAPTVSDRDLVDALRAGDETAFMMLVEHVQPTMLRIARMYVPTRAIAEEVVQDAWVGVLRGLDAFEGRSSLRTWILRILVNTAKTRGNREASQRAVRLGLGQRPGWEAVPEKRLLSRETLRLVSAEIDALPPNQREVIRLRDVLGWSSKEVCNALDLSETNQRVLLHRAHAKVRRALEAHLAECEGCTACLEQFRRRSG